MDEHDNSSSYYYCATQQEQENNEPKVNGTEEEEVEEQSFIPVPVPKRTLKHHSTLPIQPMRFVIISDTHCLHEMVTLPPDGADVLLHCGDFTNTGLTGEVDSFFQYLIDHCDGLFKYIIMCIGNHEWLADMVVYPRFQKFFKNVNDPNSQPCTLKSQYFLLLDETITIMDNNNHPIKIHGVRYRGTWAPPLFFKKTTFNIPKDTDILMTHFPCNKFGMDISSNGVSRGSVELTALLDSNHFNNLKIHCFGHNHNPDARGFVHDKDKDRVYLNAISVIGHKEDRNIGKPFVFDF